MSIFPLCSPGLEGGVSARASDLSRYLLLRSDAHSGNRGFAPRVSRGLSPTRGPIFNDASHMMQAAIEGQGIALARSSLHRDDLVNGVLVRLFDVVVPSPSRYLPRLSAAACGIAEGAALSRMAARRDRARPADAGPRAAEADARASASSAAAGEGA